MFTTGGATIQLKMSRQQTRSKPCNSWKNSKSQAWFHSTASSKTAKVKHSKTSSKESSTSKAALQVDSLMSHTKSWRRKHSLKSRVGTTRAFTKSTSMLTVSMKVIRTFCRTCVSCKCTTGLKATRQSSTLPKCTVISTRSQSKLVRMQVKQK